MPSSKSTYDQPPGTPPRTVKEDQIEYGFIGKLQQLKYEYRPDIRDRASLERNFREKFEALNRVKLSDGEFKAGEGLSETAIREGYIRFKKYRDSTELATIATRHGLATGALQAFVDGVLQRLILDGDALSELVAPLDLGWKARAQAETALMADLMPLLNKRSQGREISGLSAHE